MLKTLNQNIGKTAIMVGAGVAGAKISDGIVAIMPESTAKYKKALVAGLALIGAAAVGGKTATTQALQAGLAGVAIKQGSDFTTDQLAGSVAPKDNTTMTGRFVNAVVGHSTAQYVAPVLQNSPVTISPTSRLGNAYVDWVPAMPTPNQVPLGV